MVFWWFSVRQKFNPLSQRFAYATCVCQLPIHYRQTRREDSIGVESGLCIPAKDGLRIFEWRGVLPNKHLLSGTGLSGADEGGRILWRNGSRHPHQTISLHNLGLIPHTLHSRPCGL